MVLGAGLGSLCGLALCGLALCGLSGCGADLLPGERVLGDELPAVVLTGDAGDRLGAAVAVGTVEDQLVVGVTAPGAGTVSLLD
ncbi:MAG: hypothetical protein GXP62_19630, partial [Oligoflexia bacterium]|nr:hypothetical protein [Oligoflexia bacterium]